MVLALGHYNQGAEISRFSMMLANALSFPPVKTNNTVLLQGCVLHRPWYVRDSEDMKGNSFPEPMNFPPFEITLISPFSRLPDSPAHPPVEPPFSELHPHQRNSDSRTRPALSHIWVLLVLPGTLLPSSFISLAPSPPSDLSSNVPSSWALPQPPYLE